MSTSSFTSSPSPLPVRVHGIDLAAPGGVQALLAFHRAHFGGAQMNAAGDQGSSGVGDGSQQQGSGETQGSQGGTGGAAGSTGGSQSGSQGAGEPDRGFPANTALADMTTDQQLAYWKFQSRKHEDAAKSLAARSDYDDVKRRSEQAEAELEALRHAQMTESEKALAAARSEGEQAARAAADAEYAERGRTRGFKLVDAFLSLSMSEGGRLERDRERVTPVLGALDKSKFLTTDGDVDTDALNTFVNSLATPAPAEPAGRRGATWPSLGQGRQSAPPSEKGVDAGKAMFAGRRGKAAATKS